MDAEEGRRSALGWAGPIIAVGVALWLTHPAWGGRPPAGDDVMAVLVRADRGLGLAGQGRLVGWAPDFLLGFEQYLFYGPGFTWLLGVLRVLSLGTLSLTGAVKVAGILTYAGFSPAAAFLARSLGLTRRESGLAAILALAVNNVFGVGLAAIYTIALLPQQLAALFFCVALGCALRAVVDHRRRWLVLGAVATAGLVTTHPLSTVTFLVFLALTLPTLWLTDRVPLAGLGRLAALGAAAGALAAFWVVPYLAHFALRGPVPAWATPPIGQRFTDIMGGRILFGRGFAWLVLLGLSYGVVRVALGVRWAAALLSTPLLFLIVAHTLASHFPHLELSPQLANRGLGYVGLVALLPLAAALGAATKGFGRLGDGAAAVVAVLLVFGTGGLRGDAAQMPRPAPELMAAARQLHRLVPPAARFATQRDFPGEIERLGPSHPDFWLARQSGRNTLNVFGLELSTSPSVGGIPESIGHTTAVDSAHALARLGVTHVVTVSAEGRSLLSASRRFRLTWASRSLAIFEVLPDAGQPGPAALTTSPDGPLRAQVVGSSPDHLTVAVDAPAPRTVHLAVARSPKWHLRVNRRSQVAGHSPEGMLTASVGPGHSVIDLRFGPDRWDAGGLVVSAGAWLGLVVWAVRRWRARRRRDRPAGAAGHA